MPMLIVSNTALRCIAGRGFITSADAVRCGAEILEDGRVSYVESIDRDFDR